MGEIHPETNASELKLGMQAELKQPLKPGMWFRDYARQRKLVQPNGPPKDDMWWVKAARERIPVLRDGDYIRANLCDPPDEKAPAEAPSPTEIRVGQPGLRLEMRLIEDAPAKPAPPPDHTATHEPSPYLERGKIRCALCGEHQEAFAAVECKRTFLGGRTYRDWEEIDVRNLTGIQRIEVLLAKAQDPSAAPPRNAYTEAMAEVVSPRLGLWWRR